MAVIYFIIIFLGILAVGLAINKPFRQQLNLKFHGRTEAIMAENASTPEGAEDIFSAAIQEKQKKFFEKTVCLKSIPSLVPTWKGCLGTVILKKGKKRSTNRYSQCLSFNYINSTNEYELCIT